ncbi:unnamed protein product, partial [marine sediment metagenome]
MEVEFISLLKDLKDKGEEFNVSFWEEGVDWAKVAEGIPAAENDDIDRLIYMIDDPEGCPLNKNNFDAFVTTTLELSKALIIGEAFVLWHKTLYDEEVDTDDWYSIFGDYSTRMDSWLVELRSKKGELEGILLSRQADMALIEARIEAIEGDEGEIDVLEAAKV